ncbi:cAMP-binding domain of CRP or a regulatory subunit of cAMP-dependent protein kinases [Dyadobacter soli]|uniref:cAMP-binding domain of CRP or a regulatory subunit of cAMP-dependent protein kinases n=1 Tax=Dyadobacter soli TaxID=659014 RepID=A0A1G7GGR3_9BACT|nr:Crp/Fnr family transcriptional regulator [Dyadobacter soli]SDE87320.1 cAMP-binding domain of CRP or a regulatory subunit of cAMP-dependent protein kinases [Dyadobacter soli]
MANQQLQAEWGKFGHLFTREEIPAKTVLLREGEVAKKVYFIEKGCLRLSFNKDGKDITFQFFLEGEGVSSAESFRYDLPSLYSIETLEPAVLHTLTKKAWFEIIEASPLIREAMEEQTLQRLLFVEKLFLSRIKNSPEERYRELLEQRPEILQRVPQHYIASFLGITSVSLSRIRNRR